MTKNCEFSLVNYFLSLHFGHLQNFTSFLHNTRLNTHLDKTKHYYRRDSGKLMMRGWIPPWHFSPHASKSLVLITKRPLPWTKLGSCFNSSCFSLAGQQKREATRYSRELHHQPRCRGGQSCPQRKRRTFRDCEQNSSPPYNHKHFRKQT